MNSLKCTTGCDIRNVILHKDARFNTGQLVEKFTNKMDSSPPTPQTLPPSLVCLFSVVVVAAVVVGQATLNFLMTHSGPVGTGCGRCVN